MRTRILMVVLLAIVVVMACSTYAAAKPASLAPLVHGLKEKLMTMAEQERVPIIVILKENTTVPTDSNDISVKNKYKKITGFSGRATKRFINELRQNSNVVSITMDGPVYATMAEALPMINGTVSQTVFYNSANLTGAGQAVCVIDSGIDYKYFNLGNCTTESFMAGTCNKVVAGYSWCNNTACTQSDPNPMDNNGHGTHVAGIIASNSTTVTGVAPGANLVAMKVLNSAGSNPEGWGDVVSAIDWCVNNATKFNITVISMSIGSTSVYNDADECTSSGLDATHIAIENAAKNGIYVVISSGNTANKTHIAYPSCSPNATSVGSVYDANVGSITFIGVCTDSTTAADKVACYSNGGILLDMLAPGSRITSANYNTGTGTTIKDGTSMACPMVSGAAVLLNQYKQWESNRTMTAVELKNAFKSTGINVTDARTGAGNAVFPRLNIYAALLSIDEKAPVVNVTSPTNGTYNYTQNIPLNYTATDIIGNGQCTYNLDNGANATMTGCANATFNATAGEHNLTLFVTDIAGNTNTTVVAFSIDYLPPNITLVSPANSSSIDSGIFINFTITDENSQVDSVWWTNNTNERNNATRNGSYFYINTSRWLSQIWQNVTIYANDTINNTASAFYRFVNNSVPRLLKNISQQNWSEDTTFTLNLTDFFNDTDSSLTYSASAVNNITIVINQINGNVSLTPDANFNGIRHVFFYITDGFATNTSDNATLNITNVNDAPVFMLLENKTAMRGYAFSYDINATDVEGDELNYSIINVTNATGTFINFTINVTTGVLTNSTPVNSTGFYMIYLNVTDGTDWTVDILNITVNRLPLYNNFQNELTTNFTLLYNDSTINNVTNLTIGVPWVGLINYSGHIINLDAADLDNNVIITYNHIEVKSNIVPQLNLSARIIIYNLSFSTTPLVMRDGAQCTTCTIISYVGGNFTFDVTGFTTYSAATTTTTTVATTVAGGGGGGGGGTSTTTALTSTSTTTALTSTTIGAAETTAVGAMEQLFGKEGGNTMSYILVIIVIVVILTVFFYYHKPSLPRKVLRKRRSRNSIFK